jgi:glycosyltransferase involved in cell wall biosynthesis
MPAKPTILHIIASLDHGGAVRQMSQLAARQQRDGFDVHIRAAGGGSLENELCDARVDTSVIKYRGLLDLPALWKLCREVKRLQPAVIHAWGSNVQMFLTVSRHTAAKHTAARHTAGNTPLVITLTEPGRPNAPVERAVDRYSCRNCRRMVVNSSAHKDLLLRWEFPPEKLLTISGGTPPSEPSTITRRQLLDRLGLPEGSRLVATVGRLALRKNLKDAIWAADLLKVIRDDVHLLIIGDGPHSARLHKFRDQVEIPDKVHFLGTRGDVADFLPHLDAFWSASSREGHSPAILEAMSAGVPVVATDIPGNRELITNDSTGYLVPVGDRASIARTTNRILDDADLAERIGSVARQRVAEHFPAEKMLQAYAELYGELL